MKNGYNRKIAQIKLLIKEECEIGAPIEDLEEELAALEDEAEYAAECEREARQDR